jgi:hypothetical protein
VNYIVVSPRESATDLANEISLAAAQDSAGAILPAESICALRAAVRRLEHANAAMQRAIASAPERLLARWPPRA